MDGSKRDSIMRDGHAGWRGRRFWRREASCCGGQQPPLIAVVRLRKRNEWVLPKGKLDDGETPRDAAEREVLEETGHDVCVHEFLGTLVYEFGGRSKIVHYWRMETSGEQAYELMDDIRAVDWLPLDAALERLSRGYERAFLEHVGPLALAAAAPARLPRPAKAKKQPVAEKRRRRPLVTPPAAMPVPVPIGSVATRCGGFGERAGAAAAGRQRRGRGGNLRRCSAARSCGAVRGRNRNPGRDRSAASRGNSTGRPRGRNGSSPAHQPGAENAGMAAACGLILP